MRIINYYFGLLTAVIISMQGILLASPPKKRVDLVTYSTYLLPREDFLQYKYLKHYYDLNASYDLYQYVKDFKGDDPNLQKIIFLDYCEDPNLRKLPKNKLVCFKWEAHKARLEFYEPYSVVYTFDDDLVDGKKFLKFYYPVLKPRIPNVPSFEEKKLFTMVAGNWIPERVKILDFFAQKPNGEFEFYGHAPSQYWTHEMYHGHIGGYYSSDQKLEVIKNYRFCFAFENTHTTPGYITEKIFDVFGAGAVPIYWGPNNVEKYIPKNCFIDYRDFSSDEQLYQFLKAMPKETYNQYLENIKLFLTSEKAHVFSTEYFDILIYQAASQ